MIRFQTLSSFSPEVGCANNSRIGDSGTYTTTIHSDESISKSTFRMPLESPYFPVTFREVDLWDLLFERSDREFPDDKGNRHKIIFLSISSFLNLS